MAEKRKILVGFCKMRWSDICYERFYLAMPFIAESLEIINGTFENNYTNGWNVHT